MLDVIFDIVAELPWQVLLLLLLIALIIIFVVML